MTWRQPGWILWLASGWWVGMGKRAWGLGAGHKMGRWAWEQADHAVYAVQKGASLGQALASLANISLGWKGLPETNTHAYYEYL